MVTLGLPLLPGLAIIRTMSDAPLKSIRAFLDQPDAVVFVGSGISCWSGLPRWTQVIEELADLLDRNGDSSELIRREARNGDLLQAASYGFSKLTPIGIGAFIRNIVRVGIAQPCEIHRAIVQLGPTCFITTNYDDLLEEALRKWRRPESFRSVTNRNLAEIAEIMGARASKFVFKPHGDAGDASSIVLTREQYRSLMPGGERHRALEALKTLLVTRPVLYLGFGLRDPDFLYLRDILLNTFDGITRDHYAVIPDVRPDEIEYWRNQYGIRLVGYRTRVGPGGEQDHSDLLKMLIDLSPEGSGSAAPVVIRSSGASKIREAEYILALTRYTAGLVRMLPDEELLETRVSLQSRQKKNFSDIPHFEHWTATRFLTVGPPQAVLVGLPGAGKTFAARVAVVHLARLIYHACLNDSIVSSGYVLPVFVDLKLYRGDLRAQIEATLPAGFDLEHFVGNFRLKLFLDAFNEMPSEYLEDGSLVQSIEELRRVVGDFDYVITSRTIDGVPENLVTYELDRFRITDVVCVLKGRGIVISGNFKSEIEQLLARPFFLHLVTSGAVNVPDGAGPSDIYESYLHNLKSDFFRKFNSQLPIAETLSDVAFRAIDEDREAFPLNWVSGRIESRRDYSGPSAQDIINWLISRGTLISYTGSRVSFAHQSITEYLAALELTRRVEAGALSLRDTVILKKWDQCLFLALGLMDASTADEIIEFLASADLSLAFNAVRYAEEGQSAAITRLLSLVPDEYGSLFDALRLRLTRVPFGSEHAPYLERFVERRGMLGADAVKALANIRGVSYKDELFRLLSADEADYNFQTNGVAPAISSLLCDEDLPRLLDIAIDIASRDNIEDNKTAIGNVLSQFAPDLLISGFHDRIAGPFSSHIVQILCRALGDRGGKRSFDILMGFVQQAHYEAIFYLMLLLGDGRPSREEMVSDIEGEHVRVIWAGRFSSQFWCGLLEKLCSLKPELTAEVEVIADKAIGVERMALLQCLGKGAGDIRGELLSIALMTDEQLNLEQFGVFRMSQLDWSGAGLLYVQLLSRNNVELRSSLLGGGSRCVIKGLENLPLDAVAPLIGIASDMGAGGEYLWHKSQIGSIVAQYGDKTTREYLIDRLARGETSIRVWVKDYVIQYMDGLTTEDLPDEAIAFLLSDLFRPGALVEGWRNPLGKIATERFIIEKVVPLAQGASDAVLKNIQVVLNGVGTRHGRRYLI